MSDPLEKLKVLLKQHEQSITNARLVVFSALQDSEPQAMSELVLACHGKINRASIYRVISLFEELGVVQRIQMGWKYKLELSDSFQHHHHHLTCTVCGKIESLDDDTHLEHYLVDASIRHGFSMSGHQLEIQGVCGGCSTTSEGQFLTQA
jgi:Fur family ferric uptake transcriptional regulator